MDCDQGCPMIEPQHTLALRNAHVIDPAQGIDRVTNVLVRDGRILAVGDEPIPSDAKVLDLAGQYLTPGWVDMHVHTYGTLGFADPDSIGIFQGVTSFVDAGGPGIASLDEFVALLHGHTITDLYAGPYIRPMGIIGAQFVEGDIRSLTGFPITEWLDFCGSHPGLVRYLKVAALGGYGSGPIKMAKGLAEIIGVPLYGHIGEYQMQPEHPSAYELFRIAEAGDMIAHVYHNNGARILDRDGRLLPVVRDAQSRGVLFDVAFGSYNFSWDLAEQAFAQGLPPDIISSDLQQFNAIGPAYSLAHVMGILLRLGMTLQEVVRAVTSKPAEAIQLSDRAGSLKPGMPADITVFRVESGTFELADTDGKLRTADRRIVPVMAFKDGQRYGSDLARCQDERNWMLQIAEDHVPAAVSTLQPQQLDFLRSLHGALEHIDWQYDLEHLDLAKATELRQLFQTVLGQHKLTMRDGLLAVFACFLDSPFTMQIGLFLLHLERSFALARLGQVTGQRLAA